MRYGYFEATASQPYSSTSVTLHVLTPINGKVFTPSVDSWSSMAEFEVGSKGHFSRTKNDIGTDLIICPTEAEARSMLAEFGS